MTNKNIVLRIIISVFFVLSLTSAAPSTHAASLDEQLKQKQQELDQAQAAAANKAQEARTLDSQINGLESNIAQTEKSIQDTGAQIDEKQNSITGLSSDIETKKKELALLKKKLDDAIVEIYRSSDRSNLELLFGSGSLSDSANQSKYIESIQMQVKIMLDKVKTIKTDLEKKKSDEEAKKAELDQLKNQQVAYKKSTEYQKAQKDKLKSMTLAQQAEYEAMANKISKEVSNINSQIAKARQGGSKKGQNLGGGSAYSYSCGNVDPWGFWTCQCTSYAAWYWNVKLGRSWERGAGEPGTGDAKNWPNLASRNGVSVHSVPQIGALISWPGDGIYISKEHGHVAIVEEINDGGEITISEYNWYSESYSKRRINPSDYGSYSYIY